MGARRSVRVPDRSRAMVEMVEVVVFVEETGLFELVDCFFDHVAFVDDFEGDGAEHAGTEEKAGEEDEESEDIDIAAGAIRSTLIQQSLSNLALPHAAQTECSDGDGECDAFVLASAKVLRARCYSGKIHAACSHAHSYECNDHRPKRPSVASLCL